MPAAPDIPDCLPAFRISSLLLMEYSILPTKVNTDLLLFSWFSLSLCFSVSFHAFHLSSPPAPTSNTHAFSLALFNEQNVVYHEYLFQQHACWILSAEDSDLTTKCISSTSPGSTKIRIKRLFFSRTKKTGRKQSQTRILNSFQKMQSRRGDCGRSILSRRENITPSRMDTDEMRRRKTF